ncbi:alpha/beta hydrolase [Undibacterium sp. TS12]|uniref:lipase family alpha/beta hydrolase n=1 Tax=Undibacterium sp. TS12 TaxID=2908202 RepID=UPI001F4CBD97|nr:alpha/beta hydrolase [Undibacterium sp. TS12]MCH8622139.1 alpha/beta hydrolase [Undibacterium sp. TS12]
MQPHALSHLPQLFSAMSLLKMMHRCLQYFLGSAIACVCLSACTFVKLNEDAKVFYSSTVFVGSVSSDVPWDKPVVVAAYSKHDGRLEIAHYTVLHEPGAYELIVPKGQYGIFAFGDANGNLRLDTGEPVGQYASSVEAIGTGVVAELNFVISPVAQAVATAVPAGTVIAEPPINGKLHSTQIGAIAELDLPVFSAEFGKSGYWAPVDFFKKAGGNIYFLEKYDPAKIPVLFVHGVAGSPQDWKYFIEHLDRNRYQPWLFYYPSGASLDSMSYLLYWKLTNLQRRYHFDRIYFTAHSMGGMVVRSFLSNYGAEFPVARLFVSLSTPWGGDTMADSGVRYSPVIVPSWNDMQSTGRFVQTLFEKPLPPELDYYLFFGHGGSYSLLHSANTDGSITLASELRADAQADARMVKGFNESHVSILSSPEVFRQYTAVLATADKKYASRSAGKGDSGNLSIAFTYEVKGNIPKSDPLLLLTPVDGSREKILLPMSAHDSGVALGPIPPGEYTASVVAYGFATVPAKTPVLISNGKKAELKFSFVPQGVLSAYIGAEIKPGDNPAGSYREPHQHIQIESITLTGEKESRTLTASDEIRERDLGVDAYLAGRDYSFQSSFSFVGLKEGQYELRVKARGYQPYRQTYHIIPGQYAYLKPIDLTPLKN